MEPLERDSSLPLRRFVFGPEGSRRRKRKRKGKRKRKKKLDKEKDEVDEKKKEKLIFYMSTSKTITSNIKESKTIKPIGRLFS